MIKKKSMFCSKLSLNLDFTNQKIFIPGKTFLQKIDYIQKGLNKLNKSLVLSDLGDIAYVFNLRENDFTNNPYFYAYSYIGIDGKYILFLDNKFSSFEKDLFKRYDIEIKRYSEFYEFLRQLPKDSFVVSNPNSLIARYSSEEFKLMGSMRDKKTDSELYGMFQSQLDDSVAMIRLFYHIYKANQKGNFMTERQIAEKLKEIKKTNTNYLMESFEAIVGYGPNSAIIHHCSSETLVGNDSVLLIDCGSQYINGTTDITRVLHFGNPTKEMKRMYTLVLKGHLKGKMLKCKQNMYKPSLSVITRFYLHFENQDFAHGISHGISHVGNVHENTNFVENSVFTIEPGYYKENEFGIRLEDDVFMAKNEHGFHFAKELTLVPYEKSLIDFTLLDSYEKDYLAHYNDLIEHFVSDLLTEEEKSFLRANTIDFFN